MGKGNRNRNDRYEDIYSMSGSGAATKTVRGGAKKDRTIVLMISVIAVLVLVALAITVFSDSGVLERNTVYVSSENYEVTGTMLPYYENLAYVSMFEQYYYLYYNYYYAGDATKAYNAVAQLMSGYTLDSFFDSAIETAKEVVALAEEATANGVTLDGEELESVEAELKEISAGSLGTGVKKKDVRQAVELRALAAKYAQQVEKTVEEGITKEGILAFVQGHKADYYRADALKYEFLLKAEEYADTLAYVTAERLVDTYASRLAAASSVDEFKRLVIEYEVEKNTDFLITSNLGSLERPDEATIESAKAELVNNLAEAILTDSDQFDSGVTEDARYAELFEAVATKLYAACLSTVANLEITQAYTEEADDEAIAWMSNSETAVGATKLTETSTEEEYTKTVYMLTKTMYLDESVTKDVAHILIKAEKDKATAEEKAAAKAKADKLLADFLAGEATLEKFEELAKDNNEDSNCVYKNVNKGQMVETFDAWIFDESRKAGDTGVVETEFGYHIMYFIGDGHEAYYANAKDGYVSEKYTEVVGELAEKHVTVNEKAVAKNTKETTKAA